MRSLATPGSVSNPLGAYESAWYQEWGLDRAAGPEGRKENSFLVDDAVQTPHQADPNVPENLSNLVMECLPSDPGRRPESMTELARRLQIIRHVLVRRAPVPRPTR